MYLNSYMDAGQLALKMSSPGKKTKIDTECHVFNKSWTAKHLFTEVKGNAVCFVCGAHVGLFTI